MPTPSEGDNEWLRHAPATTPAKKSSPARARCTYVKTNGQILHFVDSKAEKNYFLGREARDLEWTEEGRNQGGE